jgi:hypothetical protein
MKHLRWQSSAHQLRLPHRNTLRATVAGLPGEVLYHPVRAGYCTPWLDRCDEGFHASCTI